MMYKIISYLFIICIVYCVNVSFGEQLNDLNISKNNTTSKNTAIVNNNEQFAHVVQSGENLYRISLKYNVSQKDLMEVNNIKNASNIFVGQKLKIPNQNQENNKIESKDINKIENSALNRVENVKTQQLNLVNKIDNTTFIWPSRGIIIAKFGHPTKTGKLEGIIIGGENGSVVRASSSGEVVYNDKVVGYDNVILIHHYNGFYTAYGYTDPLITVGDKVKKGQAIAYMTKGSQSKRSQLYFSIRKSGKTYDPEKIIQTKIND